MYKKVKGIFLNNSGSTIILAAVILPLLVVCMAVAIDLGRVYTAQVKAQNASDAALLGAVATENTINVEDETKKLFKANYPDKYLDTVISKFVTKKISSNVYETSFTLSVPTFFSSILSNFQKRGGDDGGTKEIGKPYTDIGIISQVTRGFEVTANRRLELALVLDNSGSMSYTMPSGVSKMQALKNASSTLVNILFGNAEQLENLNISIVPFDNVVNIGVNRADWIQEFYTKEYMRNTVTLDTHYGAVANRNGDYIERKRPPYDSRYNDLTDEPPTTEYTRFRLPIGSPGNTQQEFIDRFNRVAEISFALNSKSQLLTAINNLSLGYATRSNVGMMWGWFTLSPKWRGVWDSSTNPRDPSPILDKAVVLMSDGRNSQFLGDYTNTTGTFHLSDDNKTAELLCTAMKSQGILIYTIGFAANADDLNETVLKNCATNPNYYFFAPSEEDLTKTFKAIADDIKFSTIRLSK